ncbi:MAG: ABC transporter substrate-binding protein, partial [Thermoplasmata archaeon]
QDPDFGVDGDLQATVATGPFILDSWTPFVGAELSLYDNYWGKGVSISWAGVDYPFFPETVDRIKIKIFGTLDVALLALSRGDVHIVPWNTGPSYYNALSTNPNLDFTIATESGMFYLAFNMRKEPMSLWGDNPVGTTKDPINMAFRKAVAHTIDKDFIVDRLMGGFGVKGTVPIGILKPGYVNASAVPPEFDLTAAQALLDDPLGDGFDPTDVNAANNTDAFLDRDGDGWRDMPVDKGGGPIQFSILTPPKDYDPIRADSGIMISKNLKSIGLNIDSAPTSFDTIVTQAFVTFEFDLYILGWGLGSFPENYLRTFFATGGGNNAPGYNNPAYDLLMDAMDVEFDTATRQQIIKDATGLLVEDLPYDVLYYRQSIIGHRKDVWEGWIPDGTGEVYSFFSISKLRRPAAPVLPTPELDVSLNIPSAAAAKSTVTAQVLVTQGGLPASGASVAINWTFGPDMTATTDANGVATVSITLPFVSGTIVLTATASKGGVSGGDIASITVIPRTPLARLDLSIDPVVILPNGTTTVTATVIDENGDGIAGVDVVVDPETLLGSVDAATKPTNATGIATFTYTPPGGALLLNRHIYDLFKASISVPDTLVPGVQSMSLLIGIDNPERDWRIIDVLSVSNPSVKEGQTTDVTVMMMWPNGTAIAGGTVELSMSGNTSAFTVDAMSKVTDAEGKATFTLTGNVSAAQETNHTILQFDNASALSISDGVSLIAWNGTDWNFGRAALVDYTVRAVGANSETTVTVTLWNETGQPPMKPELNETGVPTGNLTGENVYFELPFVPQGSAGHFDAGEYIWDWADVAEGLTNMTTGTISQTISTASYATDVVGALKVAVGGTIDGLGFDSMYFVESDFVIERAHIASLASVSFDKTFLSFKDTSSKLTVTFEDVDGPVGGMSVQLYDTIPVPAPWSAARLESLIGEFITRSDGTITVPISAEQLKADLAVGFTAIIVDPEFPAGFFNPDYGLFEGALPYEIRMPYLFVPDTLVVTGSVAAPVVKVDDSATFSLMVEDLFGNPVEGATVFGGTEMGTTASDGTVTLEVPIGVSGINSITFTAIKDEFTGSVRLGAIGGVGSFSFANQAIPTDVAQGSPVTLSVDVTNSGPVADSVTVDLVIDGVVVASKVVDVAAGATITVDFEWTFTDAEAHSVSLAGLTAESISAAPPPGVMDLVLAVVLMVVLLVVGLVAGFFVARMRRGGQGGGPPPTTE